MDIVDITPDENV